MNMIELHNGEKIPPLGYGTFQIFEEKICEECIYEAIKQGYRLIDTASSYGNEQAIGKGIQRAIKDKLVTRDELYIVTKLWVQDAGYEEARHAFELSLKNLGVTYVDLYLIHQPYGDYYSAWRAMEDMVEAGVIKSIGVCNFMEDRLVDLCMNSRIKPVIDQVEIHPFMCNESLIKIMKTYNVKPMAWGPLSEGQHDIFHNTQLQKLAKKYQRTVAQIVLRWHLQNGVITIPKTVHKERMEENIRIFDFELTESDMRNISNLDLGHSEIIDHRSGCTAKWINEWKIHD
ncbi:MAG: aldo/keto reductase [Lachnospiraceae bacterium]|nr:aldo/keto reductase [Lachnospiraceae bacterium]MDD3616711.1 aldo/keto reductase [Lachnospiraceae bacterium]